jgi:ABC-type transport system substrate-binding protein
MDEEHHPNELRGLSRAELVKRAAVLGLSVPMLESLIASNASALPQRLLQSPRRGGTLRIGLASNFEDFDPQRSPFGNYPFIEQLYNPIVRDHNQPDASKPTPWLGRLEFARDSSYVDVILKPGIRFHKGDPLNSQAVIANINKARDVVKGADTKAAWDPIVKNTKRVNDLVTRVTFKEPSPPEYVTQLFSLLELVSPSLIRGNYKKIRTQADGTGAFRLVSYKQGDEAVMERNPRYFRRGLPYLDRLVFTFFTDPDAQVAALESGGVDMAIDVPPSNLERLKQRFQIIKGAPALCYEFMMSADTGKPFERKAARQAMQFLVNRQRFAKDIMFGAATVAWVHVDPNSIGYDKKYEKMYRYDPAEARRRFQSLGMLNKEPIKIMQLQGIFPNFARLAEMVAGDMNAIGLRAELDPVDITVMAANTWGTNKGNYEAFTSFMGRGNRYPTFLSQGNIQLNAVSNPAFPNDKPPAKYNKGFLELSHALTASEQRKWSLQMTQSIMDESWDIAVAYQRTQYPTVKNFSGFRVTRDEHPILEGAFFTS